MFLDSVLEGRKVRLRSVTEADLPFFVRWLNDPDINRWLANIHLAEKEMDNG